MGARSAIPLLPSSMLLAGCGDDATKTPDGEPSLIQLISGKPLTVAAVDLTSPAAVVWSSPGMTCSSCVG